MMQLALVNVWLYRYSGQCDIVVGVPVSNRRHVEAEPLIGLLINTLACRTEIDGSASFTTLLTAVRARLLGDDRYQGLPVDRLIDALGVPREPARSPLFQVLFNMVAVPDVEPSMSGLAFEEWDVGDVHSTFDLLLGARRMPSGSEFSCAFQTSLFRLVTIERMLDGFVDLARLIAAAPEAPLDGLTAQAIGVDDARHVERKRQQAQRRRALMPTVCGRPMVRTERE
jgi:non-ribosomal peptide synthetase component F